MTDLLDAMDELATVRDLVNLMWMAHRKSPDQDEKSIGTSCHIILERLEMANGLLTSHAAQMPGGKLPSAKA